jgi:predicted amidohydrolase
MVRSSIGGILGKTKTLYPHLSKLNLWSVCLVVCIRTRNSHEKLSVSEFQELRHGSNTCLRLECSYGQDDYPGGVNFFGESKIIGPFGKVVIKSDPVCKDTAFCLADIDLSLVEKARKRQFFNLYTRRPELYKGLLRKTHVAPD